MNRRELFMARRRARRALRGIRCARPWTRESLLGEISRQRGRPVTVEQMEGALSTEACGLLVQFDSADHIILGAGTPQWHQDAVTAHEIAHLLLGHRGDLATPDAAHGMDAYFPDLDLSEVHRLLKRENHSSLEEYEAEFLGTLILARMTTGIEGERQLRQAQETSGGRELWRAFGVDNHA